MGRAGGAIALTAYQANKLMLVGWNGQQMPSQMRHFLKPMGLAVSNDGLLVMATQEAVWLFANAPHLFIGILIRVVLIL